MNLRLFKVVGEPLMPGESRLVALEVEGAYGLADGTMVEVQSTLSGPAGGTEELPQSQVHHGPLRRNTL